MYGLAMRVTVDALAGAKIHRSLLQIVVLIVQIFPCGPSEIVLEIFYEQRFVFVDDQCSRSVKNLDVDDSVFNLGFFDEFFYIVC